MAKYHIDSNIMKRIALSIIFGLFGFWANFHALNLLPHADFKITILIGLIFPLIVSLFWGWRYGLLSALAGGCQTMWYLWYSDGYGMLYSVPVYTLWIVWHGYWANVRKSSPHHWYQSIYIVEAAFRLVVEFGFFTVFRWLISLNPPFWDGSITNNFVSMDWLSIATKKHIITGYILLMISDLLMHIKPVRKLFIPKEEEDYITTTYIVSAAVITGCLLWMIHSLLDFHILNKDYDTFLNITFLNIPKYSLYMRYLLLIFSVVSGLILSRIYLSLKKKDLQLLKSESRFHNFIDACPDLIFSLDTNARINYYNPQTALFFANPQELTGSSFFNLVAPGFLDITRSNFFKGIKGKTTAPYTIGLNTDLKGVIFFEIHAHALWETEGSISGRIAVLRDVTQLREHEKEIHQKNQLLNKINETNPNAIIITDAIGKITYANNVARDILGFSNDNIKDLTYNDYRWNITDFQGKTVSEDELPFNLVKNSLKSVYNIQHSIQTGNNPPKLLNINAAPVLDENGELQCMIATLEDITLQIQNEQELKKYRQQLEQLVIDRTLELEEKNKTLQHYLKLFQDREFRIKELRDKIKSMENQK
ncbi:MAG: PAS domain-containing protein [Candidatus Cloacimonetes bacterium]|nr:PAS domain-containing protein [Candidatus Cloacimonadota bacterium]